jgi:basic membrane protein A
MRRVVVLLGVLALLATACGGAEEVGSIGLVYDIGGRGDQSFNDSAAAGLDKAKAEFEFEAFEQEPTAGGENREELLNLVSDEGAGLVFGVGFLFADGVAAAADAHPDVNYGLIDGFLANLNADCEGVEPVDDGAGNMVACRSNVRALSFAEHEGSFLVGAAAGLKTTTKKIGFIGGVEIDLIKKFQAGFEAGVAATCPDCTVEIKYISQPPDFSGFGDSAKGKEIGLGMYQGGADVVYHAAGGSGTGLFEAAKEFSESSGSKVWAIGVDSDQYLTAAPEVRDYILTSMLKRVDVAVYETIRSFENDEFQGGYQAFGLADDGVGYATSGGFVDDIKAQLEDLKAKVVSGEITVPDKP